MRDRWPILSLWRLGNAGVVLIQCAVKIEAADAIIDLAVAIIIETITDLDTGLDVWTLWHASIFAADQNPPALACSALDIRLALIHIAVAVVISIITGFRKSSIFLGCAHTGCPVRTARHRHGAGA